MTYTLNVSGILWTFDEETFLDFKKYCNKKGVDVSSIAVNFKTGNYFIENPDNEWEVIKAIVLYRVLNKK